MIRRWIIASRSPVNFWSTIDWRSLPIAPRNSGSDDGAGAPEAVELDGSFRLARGEQDAASRSNASRAGPALRGNILLGTAGKAPDAAQKISGTVFTCRFARPSS